MSMNIRWIKITALLCWGCLVLCSQTMSAQCPPAMSVCNDMTITEGSSVQLWAQGAQVYQWTPASGLSSDTAHNPVASPTQTTTYTVTGYNLHGPNQVVNGDFEAGNTGFTSNYTFMSNSITGYGQYTINTDGQIVWGTGGHIYGYGGSGYFMSVDGATSPNSVVWQQTVSVIPNTHYAFSAQVVSMLNSYQQNAQALLQFCINGTTVGPIFHAPDVLNTWVQYYELWYSGNATSATLTILNQNTNGTGNDFGLDNISFYNLDSCSVSMDVTVTVLPGTGSGTGLPDNMEMTDCTTEADAMAWGISNQWSSSAIVSNYNIPLVGDLDGDGHPEVVCFAHAGDYFQDPRKNDQILVFDGVTQQQEAHIHLPSYVTAFDAAAYGLVKTSSGKGLVVVACYDYKLRAYDITAANPDAPFWVSNVDYGSQYGDWGVNVCFADFNADGHPEVYVRNKIYNAETGVLLATAPTNMTASSYAHHSHSTGWKLSSPIAADVTGNQLPELILGNAAYSVNISNLNGTAGNNLTLAAQTNPPSQVPTEGNPQVADFNSDGFLDVFISVRDTSSLYGTVFGYVWDVHNSYVSTPFSIPTSFSGKSIPLIADIDNDGKLEIVIQSGVDNSYNKIQAYKYHPNSHSFSLMWGIAPDENSYSNGITSFDFNQDGILELLVCDQSTMKIVNGSGKSHITHLDTVPVYVISSLPYTEVTIMQYPVIADVDADGAAEIVSVGNFQLNIFKSSGNPWAPARPVWNQYMYNVTNVNKDLTIPSPLFNNATSFTDPLGVVRRPFNNFLQQATMLDEYGRPFMPLANASATNDTASTYTNGTYTFTFRLCNTGSQTLSAPYHIAYYANTYQGPLVATETISTALAPDSCLTWTVQFSDEVLQGFSNMQQIVVALNDNGSGVAQSGGQQTECDTTDNFFTFYASPCHIPRDTILAEVCEHEPYSDENFNITPTETAHAGEYFFTKTYPVGDCDSTIVLHLQVHPTYTISLTESIPEEMDYNRHGIFISAESLSGVEQLDTTLTLQSVFGCDSVLHLNIRLSSPTLPLYLPNAITANGDGLNDEFFIPEKAQSQMSEFEIYIYNRWGELVFFSLDKGFRWDGSYRGKIYRNVVYQYVIRCKNLMGRPLQYKGSLTVL